MSRIHCNLEDCSDKDKYGTLIYSITCEACFAKKMKLQNGAGCKCTLIETCDECIIESSQCLKPEKPGVTFCKECSRKLTQGSPSCVRCGKCARSRRENQ